MLVPKNATRLKIGNLIGYVPASWNDLPREKAMNIVSILLLSGQEDLTAGEAIVYQRINILAVLMGTTLPSLLKLFGFNSAIEIAFIDDERTDQLNQVLETITFCFEAPDPDQPEQLRVNLGLTRCLYPVITNSQGINYYAPADELENITIYELSTILTLMDAYTREQTDDGLHQLLATVYRPVSMATAANRYTGRITSSQPAPAAGRRCPTSLSKRCGSGLPPAARPSSPAPLSQACSSRPPEAKRTPSAGRVPSSTSPTARS
jgi:hypothetical protein